MAYDQLEPFGERQAFLRSGIVAATVANSQRNPKQRAKAFQPLDFIPAPYNGGGEEPKSVRRQSPEYMAEVAVLLNTALGGRDLRSDKRIGSSNA